MVLGCGRFRGLFRGLGPGGPGVPGRRLAQHRLAQLPRELQFGVPQRVRTVAPLGQRRLPAGPEFPVCQVAGGGQVSGAIKRRHGGMERSDDRRCRSGLLGEPTA